ncbi:thermonuclease family protein [Paramagnetospirillum magneticum]|uniref:Micrococcal nuclease homolog n=1 Tax=Paramagnetospirillum magneticum (strain ATCC 700264 / AMB-1) TaxID=342108 RepID=Q2W1E2_PARM1|nr:nuclease [Paramagnetospirillum magneticum]BAE52333.1 Micrococcal nuclease homolog [Paramagnetospirillum magneticum AMB-1]
MHTIIVALIALAVSAPALAAGPPPAAATPAPAAPMAAPAPRCAEDAEGGACVWGKAEGYDAGALQVRGLHVALAGVLAPGRKDLCGSKSAKEEFDCARPARKRMGELVARGVACEILDVASGQLWGRCKVAEGDLGRLLVSAGLARAAKDGPYAEAQKQAVTARRGLWAADMVLPRDWETARRKAEDEE